MMLVTLKGWSDARFNRIFTRRDSIVAVILFRISTSQRWKLFYEIAGENPRHINMGVFLGDTNT